MSVAWWVVYVADAVEYKAKNALVPESYHKSHYLPAACVPGLAILKRLPFRNKDTMGSSTNLLARSRLLQPSSASW